MKVFPSILILNLLALLVVAVGFSAEADGGQISLKLENAGSEGKIITVRPRNEALKQDPTGGPYLMTVRVASTLPLLRKGLFLKSKGAEIPLDTDSPPPLSLRVFVADFDFVVVEVSSIKHWSEWTKTHYFRVSGTELVPVDAEKLGLPADKTRTEPGAAEKPAKPAESR